MDASGRSSAGTVGGGRFQPAPPMRPEATEPFRGDGTILDYIWGKWESQTGALRFRDRMVEENVRMLCNQQWIVWNTALQRYVDVTHWLTDEERRWRQRPSFNRLLPWFMLTHARLVENPPILTFVPGPDRVDAQLAEVMDTIFKFVWREAGMVDVNDRMMTWLIAAGRAHLCSRVDLNRGPIRAWEGQALLPMMGPDGLPLLGQDGQPVQVPAEGVPFDRNGLPLAMMTPAGLVATGKPHFEREGQVVVDVLSPLEVRGEWGPVPWHQKRWHAQVSLLPVEEIRDRWGVEVEPDTDGGAADAAGELERLLFGTGFFGAGGQKPGAEVAGPRPSASGYARVLTYWEAPGEHPREPRMQESPESPGGRLAVATRQRVLRDGERPLRFPYTSPIRCFDFVRLPGRPQGTTPLEAMVGPQRAYNRGWAAILDHRNRMTSPLTVVDAGSGLDAVEITNEPGQRVTASQRPGVPAITFVSPPPLGSDVYRAQELLRGEIDDLGQLNGTDGAPPSRDASGELIKELRFNSDRFLGPTVRRAVEEYARMAEDWMVILPRLWDRQKVLAYAGEDNVARTVTVLPAMLQGGKVDVVPDVESMLPEGRGERQAKVYRMYQDGMFGPPGSPPAVKAYLDLARFPHLSRSVRPGGVHRVTAEQMLGAILVGTPAAALGWYPWYDVQAHLEVFTDYMAAPEFLKNPPAIQQELAARWHFLIEMSALPMAPVIPGQPLGPEGLAGAEGAAGAGGPPRALAEEPPGAGLSPLGGALPTPEPMQPAGFAGHRPRSLGGDAYPTAFTPDPELETVP